MTWTLSATGHAESKDDEVAVIDAFRDAAQATHAATASIATQHHGEINLLDAQREQQ